MKTFTITLGEIPLYPSKYAYGHVTDKIDSLIHSLNSDRYSNSELIELLKELKKELSVASSECHSLAWKAHEEHQAKREKEELERYLNPYREAVSKMRDSKDRKTAHEYLERMENTHVESESHEDYRILLERLLRYDAQRRDK